MDCWVRGPSTVGIASADRFRYLPARSDETVGVGGLPRACTGLAGSLGRTGRGEQKICDPDGVARRSKNVGVA